MIFVTGPRYAGKREYIRDAVGLSEAEFAAAAVCGAETLVSRVDQVDAVYEQLRGRQIVIASETGCGVVPIDPLEEERREAAGRLSCKLAASADVVIRVVCGIPCFLKGNL